MSRQIRINFTSVWSFAVIDFTSVHSSVCQSNKFALRWVPLATGLTGYRQAGSSTLYVH
jgi:hypothetical protein